jgi:hypothetical protein
VRRELSADRVVYLSRPSAVSRVTVGHLKDNHLSHRPKRLADARFAIVRHVQGRWAYVRVWSGHDVFAHRSALLQGSMALGDVVFFVRELAYPHARAAFVVQLPPNAPLAAVMHEIDAQRVRPMKATKLARRCPERSML